MNGIVRILGIPGSLRQASFNRLALRAARDEQGRQRIGELLAALVRWTRRLGKGP